MFFSVLLCLISAQNSRKEWKWTERSFFRMEKNVTYRTEKNGVPNPDFLFPMIRWRAFPLLCMISHSFYSAFSLSLSLSLCLYLFVSILLPLSLCLYLFVSISLSLSLSLYLFISISLSLSPSLWLPLLRKVGRLSAWLSCLLLMYLSTRFLGQFSLPLSPLSLSFSLPLSPLSLSFSLPPLSLSPSLPLSIYILAQLASYHLMHLLI